MCAAPAAAPTIADLRDRRVDHARLAELRQQPFGDLERAAVRADVLAEAEDVRVALHLLEQRLANRLEIGDLGHQSAPFAGASKVPQPAGRSFDFHRGALALAEPERLRRRRIGVDADRAHRAARARPTLGDVGRLVDLALHARVDRRELLGRTPSSREPRDVPRDRIVLALPPLDLAGGHVRLVVVLRVALPAVRHQLDDRVALAAPRAIDRALRRLVRRDDVVAVGRSPGMP